MAFPYGRTGHYSPLGDEHQIYASPASIQQQWTAGNTGAPMGLGLGSPEIEMQGRPAPQHRQSAQSFTSVASHSTLFPSNQTTPQPYSESASFLHDPLNKIDTSFSTPEYQPYKSNSARQLRHLLVGSTARFLITLGFCAGYVLATRIWVNKTAVSENQKKVYNAITTALSIALGLNIASAFKDMALNMRWPILAARKRNLRELDSFLRADSMTELFKLVFITRRFWVIVGCLAWLFINILAQAGIAMLSLTYGFDVNYNAVLETAGQIEVPDMSHFFPQGNDTEPGTQDEEYTAHLYGGLAGTSYKLDDLANKPKSGDIWKDTNAMLWYDSNNSYLEFVFWNSPVKSTSSGIFKAYSERIVNVTYTCDAHEVTARGNGSFNDIEVANIGTVSVDTVVPDSLTYFTDYYNSCSEDGRCSIVQGFEASTEGTPYYYNCNITMGKTQSDPNNISWISNDMAYFATSSIAQIGYIDDNGQEYQIYPNKSTWGRPAGGNADVIGLRMASFAMGSIAGAAIYNPTKTVDGMSPSQAFKLNLGHPFFFYLIIGLICLFQLVFIVVVAVLANKVKVGPDGHLSMSLLLRPIADSLEGVSGGRENKAYENAKKAYTVKYEKSRTGRWVLSMS